METILYRVTPDGVDVCVCRRDGDELVMEIHPAGRSPRITRKRFDDAAWQFPQLVGRKLGEGYCVFADGARAAVGDLLFESDGGGPAFDLHPDGASIAYATVRPRAAGADVYLLDLATGTRQHLHAIAIDPDRPEHVSIRGVRWTPDGAALLIGLPWQVRLVDRDGRIRDAAPLGSIERPAFDLAGGRLLGSERWGQAHSITVRSLDDLQAEPIFSRPVPDWSYSRAALSADGTEVAIVDGNAPSIGIFEVASGREIGRIATEGQVWRVGFSPAGDRLLAMLDWHAGRPVVLDRASGAVLHRFVGDDGRPRVTPAWAWSPDGRTLALAGDRLALFDGATYAERPESAALDRWGNHAAHVAWSGDGALIAYGGARLAVRKTAPVPVALRPPRPRPALLDDAPRGAGLDAEALVREWDGLAGQGEFPCGDLYFGEKISAWDARLEVFARRAPDGDRYWIVWQVIGDDGPAGEPLANHLLAVGDRPDWPRREMAGRGTLAVADQTRITEDYGLDDAEARAEDASYFEEPQDPDGAWARVQGFGITLDGEVHELAPRHADYVAAGVGLSRRQWDQNPTAALGSIARVTAHLLRDRLWYEAPLALPALAGDEAGAFVRIHRENGVEVLAEVNAAVPPSRSSRWPRIAQVLAGGPEAWAAAAREAAGVVARDPVAASAAAFERAVRRTRFAELPEGREPTAAERAAVRHLELTDDRSIIDLAPIAAYPAVRTLYLFRSGVTDLGPLAGLTDLEELNLAEVPVADLGPLAGCRKLRRLTLHHTQVADLGPLAALDGLESIDIQATDVADLGPLRRHTGLRELFLDDSAITSLEPLRGFTRLSRVYMRRTRVADVSPLADAALLAVLTLPPTVTDVSPLAGLPIYANLVDDAEDARRR
ncbi:MAG TPA: hypothetical protein VNO30_35190 [Kofleriaceae bacterium]|nr:hypothetical protein [Kofleriaceae bacterium]